MAEPTKKSSPFPLDRALDGAVPPRPLTPMRKRALPIGIAASLVLAGAGAGVYAYAASAESQATIDPPCDSTQGRYAHSHLAENAFTRIVDGVRNFIKPDDSTSVAGKMVAVPVPTQTPIAPASGSAPSPTPIPPEPQPPPLPGRRSGPTVTPASVPPTPPTPPIVPVQQHPKLGGKPSMPKP